MTPLPRVMMIWLTLREGNGNKPKKRVWFCIRVVCAKFTFLSLCTLILYAIGVEWPFTVI